MTEIVEATLEDFVALYGHPPAYSFQGFVVREDGKPVGIGGLYYSNGGHVVFSRINAPIRKRVILAVCRKVMALAAQKSAQVYAMRDAKVPTSAGLMAHFGFVPVDENNEVYQWPT